MTVRALAVHSWLTARTKRSPILVMEQYCEFPPTLHLEKDVTVPHWHATYLGFEGQRLCIIFIY